MKSTFVSPRKNLFKTLFTKTFSSKTPSSKILFSKTLPSKTWFAALLLAVFISPAHAADYAIDVSGAHASINFKIPHLGYSILVGRFDEFSGTFSYDQNNPGQGSADVVIKTASLNSNHTERDKHLRGSDFLDVEKYPEARFVGTSFESADGKTGTLTGNLTLHGVTKPVSIAIKKIGEGKDPWGGFRAGFSGTTSLTLKDFGIDFNLGPASAEVELELFVEGVRQ